jgi:hypothetical protein
VTEVFMLSRRSLAALAVLALAPLACDSKSPSTPEPNPSSTPSPSGPAATPTPSATATPTPTPTPAGNQNPAVDVRTSVTSFLRYGRLVKGRAATYIPGDVLYLTCTPLDHLGKPTKNHGNLHDWIIFSDDLTAGVDWVHTDTRTFNPDVHVSEQSHNGTIKAKCRVDTTSGVPLVSGNTLMVIQAPE